jgi:hypothetical protein
MGDLLGMDCEARLDVKVKEDGTERNVIVAFRRPTKAGAATAEDDDQQEDLWSGAVRR